MCRRHGNWASLRVAETHFGASKIKHWEQGLPGTLQGAATAQKD